MTVDRRTAPRPSPRSHRPDAPRRSGRSTTPASTRPPSRRARARRSVRPSARYVDRFDGAAAATATAPASDLSRLRRAGRDASSVRGRRAPGSPRCGHTARPPARDHRAPRSVRDRDVAARRRGVAARGRTSPHPLRATRSLAAARRRSVSSRPTTSNDSNSGGPTERPVTATLTGACALPSFNS